MSSYSLKLSGVSKRFTLHHLQGAELSVFDHVDLEVHPGDCLVLDGPSGMGKSTLLKLIYANYRASSGLIQVRQANGQTLNVPDASPRELLQMRSETVGYVSQFLRVIPRVCALDVVTESLTEDMTPANDAFDAARQEARDWLTRLNIPERLWSLPPATFSGGEQQRINIARNMIKPKPVLLLDEPTASLDKANTDTVISLIHEATERGAAVVGIFHDPRVSEAVATRRLDVSRFRSNA